MTVRHHGKHPAVGWRNLLAAFWLCITLVPTGHGFAAVVQEIAVLPAVGAADVVLRIDENTRYLYNYLPATDSLPARCYVDLYGSFHEPSLSPSLPVDNTYILQVRSHLYANKLRVVIDLRHDASCTVSSTAAQPFLLRISVMEPNGTQGAGASARLVVPPEKKPLAAGNPLPGVSAPPAEMSRTSDFFALTLATAAKATASTVEVGEHQQPSHAPWWGGIAPWGWVELFTAADTRKDPGEDHSLHRLRGRLGSDWKGGQGVVSALEWHAAVDVDRIFYDAAQAPADTDVRFHETYIKFNHAQWDVSFGNQRVRWGKSDQLSPVDSINPQDFRQFITVDLEDRALPSWLLRYRWHGETIGMETIIQPWFQGSEFEYFDSDWALYRNLRQAIAEHPATPPWLKDYARHLHVSESEPADSLENMSAAARISWKTEQADFALSYHYGWETLPTVTSFPVKGLHVSGDPDADPAELLGGAVFMNENVYSDFRRQQIAGLEWESVLDPVGFRGEVAFIDAVAFLSSNLTSKRKQVTHLVGGIDYTSASEWYFNLQGSWHHIHDFSRDLLYFEQDTVSILGEISKPVWRGNLNLALRYNYTLTDQSSYLQPALTLKYFPNFECEVGAMVFSGDGETLLGSYDRTDQVYGVIRFSAD